MSQMQCLLSISRSILRAHIHRQTRITFRKFHAVSAQKEIGAPSQRGSRKEAVRSISDYDIEEEIARKRAKKINVGDQIVEQQRIKRHVLLGTCILVFVTGHIIATMFVIEHKQDVYSQVNSPREKKT